MRIAIVNDLKMAQEVLRRAIEQIPSASLAWIASDGHEALEQCRKDRPDLILMDMVMPIMDGAVTTRAIMKECPCPVLIVTSTIEGNLSLVYEALSAGAIDAVQTPSIGKDGQVMGIDGLLRKARVALAASAGRSSQASAVAVPRAPIEPCAGGVGVPILAIGSSTGGPHALSIVLRGLDPAAQCCTVIVQHVDESYAPGLAQWLTGEIKRPVEVARDGQVPSSGSIVVAATADHLVFSAGLLRYVSQPASQIYRPSVDVFFESLVSGCATPSVALLLTGMGRDGAIGMRGLRDCGWHTIAQDRATSVVWGMPGAAVELGGACSILPLELIGAAASTELARRARGVLPSR